MPASVSESGGHHGTTQSRGGRLILLRHGESTTNAAGIFTGLLDVDLTSRGEDQAVDAGRWLSTLGLTLRAVYTSQLRRAERTAQLTVAAMEIMDAGRPPIRRCQSLAERHYGALTGRNKRDVADSVGAAMLSDWRNSATTRPSPIEDADLVRLRSQGWPVDTLASSDIRSESLNDVRGRTRPFVRDRLLPHLRRGDDALVVAHGNSLRAIAAELGGLTATQLSALRIATGASILCQVTADGLSLSRPARQ